MTEKPRALLLSASIFANDGRLQRLAVLLEEAGWQTDLCVFGDSGWDNEPSPVPGLPNAPKPAPSYRVVDAIIMAAARFLPNDTALRILRSRPVCRMLDELALQKACDGKIAYELVVVKHWTMLPTALAIQGKTGAKLWLDENEIFDAEHDDMPIWRALYRPVIKRLVSTARPRTDVITVPSLEQREDGSTPGSLYLPNTRQPVPEGRTDAQSDEAIRLLYHGLIAPNRGLEKTLSALAGCGRNDLTLTIRGYGKLDYLARLKARAQETGIADRVRFEPPVAVGRVVAAAAGHDVGLFVFSSPSRQLSLSEANKLHEYLAAGLGVIARETATTRRLVADNGCGAVIETEKPLEAELSTVFAHLTREMVYGWRKNAIAAAARNHAGCGDRDALLTLVSNWGGTSRSHPG